MRVEYAPESDHKVIMYKENSCLNDLLVCQQMALRVDTPGMLSQTGDDLEVVV